MKQKDCMDFSEIIMKLTIKKKDFKNEPLGYQLQHRPLYVPSTWKCVKGKGERMKLVLHKTTWVGWCKRKIREELKE